jgi:hypothetical protein
MTIITSSAQKKDTLKIDASNLILKNLNYGKATYLVYHKNGKDKPMQNATLVKITTQKEQFEGKDYITVKQIWEADTIIHTAKTLFESEKLKTIKHTSWWKRKGYSEHFDFLKPEITFDGSTKEELKSSITTSFNSALSSDFLNWHSDLVIFPLLPFKENRVFKINFYEPGYASPKDEIYEVLASEKLKIAGKAIDCWVLNYKVEKPEGFQRFWISKKTNELLKEEDHFTSFYRYKLKLTVDEN